MPTAHTSPSLQPAAQYAGEAKFSTWLTRIAVNEALHRLRTRGCSEAYQRLAAPAPLPVPPPEPEQRAFDHEIRQVMEAAIACLPSHYRDVVILRDVEDLSTADTAECLGISPATVKTRLHRGRAMLRARLDATLGGNRTELFAFGLARCDRLVHAVLQRIGATTRRSGREV